MEIKHINTGNILYVEVVGNIDALNNAKFEDFFNQKTDNIENHIVIDCKELDFINSSGLRILIMSLKKMKKSGKELLLCNLQNNIKDVFTYSGFDKLFDISLNKEAAFEKVTG